MSVTVTNPDTLPYRVVGAQKETTRNVAFDESYLSGGEPLTPANLGLNAVDSALCTIQTTSETSVNVTGASYDEATELIHLWNETPAEVASEANMKGLVVRVVARGH